MPRIRGRSALFIALVAALASAAALGATAFGATARAAASFPLPTGRPAMPAGRITPLQAFPTGVAASPDGKTVLAIGGPPLEFGGGGETVSLMVIDARTGRKRQVLHVADAFQSIVFNPSGTRAYVAGGNDHTIHVLRATRGGRFRLAPDIQADAFVASLALSHDGRTLWASEPALGQVLRISLPEEELLSHIPARSPDELAVSPDDKTVYAGDWRANVVNQITVDGQAVREIQVGKHPLGLAFGAAGSRLLVANSNSATLSSVDPVNRRVRRVNLKQLARLNDSPNSVATSPAGETAYVTLGNDNAIAVLRSARARKSEWRLAGLIPTAWYPIAITISGDGRKLYVVTARGLARSNHATRPYRARDPLTGPDAAAATVGTLETITVPGDRKLRAYTADVRRTLRPPVVRARGGLKNPILAGRAGPIKHVIYVTRENKTYDADLGDLHSGPGNGLTVFGQKITPNLHALERQFVESQRFFYQGFASAVGHMWEDAGTTTDTYERQVAFGLVADVPHISEAWRDRANFPPGGTLADQALRGHRTVRTYAMDTAEFGHLIPTKYQASPALYPRYDLHIADTQREAGWESEFHQFESHACAGALASAYGANCRLPDFEYVYFGNDHTTTIDQPGYPTVEAQVADNDYATGKLVDAVSHSPDWGSTLVIVVEDDPQGTGDHISPYRGFIAMASPWVRHGYISRVNYNLASAVAAIDRLLGLPPISDYAATSRPLDDLFAAARDTRSFNVDGSAVATHPFVALPGPPPKADPTHGVYSFSDPDETNPALSGASTWRQMKGTSAPPVVSAP